MRRYKELDSIRGLAALVVVLVHCLMSLPAAWPGTDSEDAGGGGFLSSLIQVDGPLVLSGIAAVRVFFVLSGFVLALPIISGRGGSYGEFLVRRVFRIYVPFAVVVVLAAAIFDATQWPPIPNLSEWFNKVGNAPITPELLGGHLLMSADARYQLLDPPIWSLVHEMRVSLIFPLLAALAIARPRLALAGALLLFGIGYSDALVDALEPYPIVLDLSRTGPFVIYFVEGIFLAHFAAAISRYIESLRHWQRMSLWLLCAILLFCPSNQLLEHLHLFAYGLGASLLICLSTNSRRAQRLLVHPFLLWLGQISYSLYLIHCVVLAVVMHSLSGKLPLWLLMLAVPLVSLGAAHITWRLIEAPSQWVGRTFAAKLSAAVPTGPYSR